MDSRYEEYLKWTDWYIVRQIETGRAVPPRVLKRRAHARASILNARSIEEDFNDVFVEVDEG